MDEGVAAQLSSVPNWSGLNNPWVPGDDKDVEYIYVNLQLNPERYTGKHGMVDARHSTSTGFGTERVLQQALDCCTAYVEALCGHLCFMTLLMNRLQG